MKKASPYIAVIIAMLIWAGSGIAVKAALESFAPLMLVMTRFTIGVLLMCCFGLVANRAAREDSILRLQKVDKQDIWLFVLGGVFQPFLYFILETYSYDAFATPTIAEAFLSTNPLIAPIFAWIFLRERVTGWNIAGILISTAGMVMLVLAGSESFAMGNIWGVPLAIVTVCMAVGYSIILKKIPAKYSALTIVFWVQLTGLVLFYILAAGKALVYPETQWFTTITPAAVEGVMYLAVLSSVAAFILFCYSVRFIGVTKANIFNNIRPVFTALIMLLLFGEQLPLWKWVGIGIIVLGLFICQKHRKK
ncbi:MAG: EamA family transporter [Paludibacteraceae bacterium]|nr:EamA family transporter [Paludibacteraceae bacterium]